MPTACPRVCSCRQPSPYACPRSWWIRFCYLPCDWSLGWSAHRCRSYAASMSTKWHWVRALSSYCRTRSLVDPQYECHRRPINRARERETILSYIYLLFPLQTLTERSLWVFLAVPVFESLLLPVILSLTSGMSISSVSRAASDLACFLLVP